MASICKKAFGRVAPLHKPNGRRGFRVRGAGRTTTASRRSGVASRWRIRHKLLLGVCLVCGVIALLLGGTLHGLWLNYQTMNSIRSKKAEQKVAKEFRQGSLRSDKARSRRRRRQGRRRLFRAIDELPEKGAQSPKAAGGIRGPVARHAQPRTRPEQRRTSGRHRRSPQERPGQTGGLDGQAVQAAHGRRRRPFKWRPTVDEGFAADQAGHARRQRLVQQH